MPKPLLRERAGDSHLVEQDLDDTGDDLDADEDHSDTEGTDDDTDEGSSGRRVNRFGYPDDTPLSKMTDAERAAYWQRRSRINENKNRKDRRRPAARDDEGHDDEQHPRARSNGGDGQADPPEAEQRGYERAQRELRLQRVEDMLRDRLEDREVNPEEIDELIEETRLRGFLQDGDIDRTRVANWVDRHAPRARRARDDDTDPDDDYSRRRGGAPTGQGNRSRGRRETSQEVALRVLRERGHLKDN